MAIDYLLIIQGNELTNERFMNELQRLGLNCNAVSRLKRGIEINQFRSVFGVTIYLTDPSPAPNDAIEFEFLRKEFKYGRCLTFEFVKNFQNADIQWKFMINIVFLLMNQLKTNAVFSFGFDTLYCFFSRAHELFINNKSGLRDNQYFIDSTAGWKCFDIEKSIVNF